MAGFGANVFRGRDRRVVRKYTCLRYFDEAVQCTTGVLHKQTLTPSLSQFTSLCFVTFHRFWQSSTFSAEVLLEHLVHFFHESPFGDNYAFSSGSLHSADSSTGSDPHEFVRGLVGLWCPTPTGLRLPELMLEDNAPTV